ncbi:glycosyltransferase [Rhodobacteraceae bacterium NNCM2]|nr:glycosyltransferase [Coraliihabitans acroporae]
MTVLSVLIPANNEAGYIGPCLESVLAQTGVAGPVEIIVAANACTDDTVARARAFAERAAARGWRLEVLDIAEGGKPNALNRADAAATSESRLYLDADIVMSPPLLGQIEAALARPAPTYASGQLRIAPAKSWVTRRYGDLWRRLPFMTRSGVTGAGLFAVNAAGRARWGEFPRIIADDTFVRLQFTPDERVGVAASYLWPMVEGFWPLVRVRRRQDAGGREIAELYPDLPANEGKPPVTPGDHLRLILAAPVSYGVYIAVSLAVRLAPGNGGWSRGR